MIRLLVACLALFAASAFSGGNAQPHHGISRHGSPALPADFNALPYAKPDAPKGGRLTIGQFGTFDSMNPYISRGAVPEVSPGSGINTLIVQSLMMRSLDEPFTLYGLVAETIDTAPDRSWVAFRLNANAKFSDGTPITSDDIRFTFDLLKEKGRPAQRNAYRRVKEVQTPSSQDIRFVFTEPDGELPLLLALMPALSKQTTNRDAFEQPSFKPPLGSGPYVLADLDPGKSFTLKRNPNFWGRNLPILQGHHNFDEIRVEFYRDSSAMFEAFKSGLFDVRFETEPSKWLESYDFSAIKTGTIVKDPLRFEAPRGMTGIMFNTRRSQLASPKVREALIELLDFEWLNRNLFRDVYLRQTSYFDQSELSSVGKPAGAKERAILAPFASEIRPDVLEGTWLPPQSDGSGRDRQRIGRAFALLKEAGYELQDGEMTNRATDRPLSLEFLALSREQEKLGLAFAGALKAVGISLRVRFVDSSLYWRRILAYDFDSVIWSYGVTASPGTEQPNRFSAAAADRKGSLNFAGVKSPAVDAALEAIRAATGRDDFVAAVRALDRALLSGMYALPLYYLPERWMARQSAVRRPDRAPRYDINFETWWRQ